MLRYLYVNIIANPVPMVLNESEINPTVGAVNRKVLQPRTTKVSP